MHALGKPTTAGMVGMVRSPNNGKHIASDADNHGRCTLRVRPWLRR